MNGLKLWDDTLGGWVPAYGMPPLSILRYGGETGAPAFDATGLGARGRWKNWALCNGQNATPTLNTVSETYIQLLA